MPEKEIGSEELDNQVEALARESFVQVARSCSTVRVLEVLGEILIYVTLFGGVAPLGLANLSIDGDLIALAAVGPVLDVVQGIFLWAILSAVKNLLRSSTQALNLQTFDVAAEWIDQRE